MDLLIAPAPSGVLTRTARAKTAPRDGLPPGRRQSSRADRCRAGTVLRANSWQSLPGNRPQEASRKVIAHAWAVREPDSLVNGVLRWRISAVATIRAALKGDLHVHSNWSDGSASDRGMMLAARDWGRVLRNFEDQLAAPDDRTACHPIACASLDASTNCWTDRAGCGPPGSRSTPRGLIAGSGARASGSASTGGGQRAFPTVDGCTVVTASNDRGRAESPTRCVRGHCTAASSRQPRQSAPNRSSTRISLYRRRENARRSRSTHVRRSDRRRLLNLGHWRSVACSPSPSTKTGFPRIPGN